MTETIKIYNGRMPPYIVWDCDDKVPDITLFDIAYGSWVDDTDGQWMRVTDDITHSHSRSLTVDTAIGTGSLDTYTKTITPIANRIGVTEYSFYFMGAPSVTTDFRFFFDVKEDATTYVRLYVRIFESGGVDKYLVTYKVLDEGVDTGIITLISQTTISNWVGLKIIWDADNKTVNFYKDASDSGSWGASIANYTFTNDAAPVPAQIVFTADNVWVDAGWDDIWIDDITFRNTAREAAASDYLLTTGEFYMEESNVGGGYFLVPEKNIVYSDHYDTQEDEFIVVDSVGTVLFTGMIDDPQSDKDMVNFKCKEITQQLDERVCRRDYRLDKGKIAEVSTV